MLICENEAAELTRGVVDPAFRADVLNGLSAPHRAIPARWFYDRRGSELFEAITHLPEYYPSRTERAILAENASEIAELTGRGRTVVEFGSGSSVKTPLLLSAIGPSAYVPVDISGDFLRESAAILRRSFPALPVHPVEGDFTRPLALPEMLQGKRLGFFPGSTIGNLIPRVAVDLLRAFAATLGTDGQLLIGIDLTKSPKILVSAYDDAAGVTAAFNLNLLHRINKELAGTIPVEDFRHVARWNETESRIEMHVQATKDVRFTVDDCEFEMGAGETIHTENSVKYGQRDARLLLRAGGWSPVAEWVDRESLFTVILAKVAPGLTAP
jgi:L-histidine N-alpha-methyltransferase